MNAIRDAELVIGISGDGFSEDYGPHVVLSHLYPIWLAHALGTPFMLCAQSIGPFRETMPFARKVLNRAAAITPRDESSETYLASIGVTEPQVTRTADISFLLRPAPGEAAEECLRDVPEGFWDRPVLGVTLSRLMGHRKSRGVRGTRMGFLDILVLSVRKVSEQAGFSVLVLIHSTGPRPARDDRIISSEFVRRLGDTVPVHFVDLDLRAEVIKAIIGRCSLFLAVRLHSAIAALSQQIPTVIIGYAAKARGIAEQLEQSDYLIPVSELSAKRLDYTLTRCWRERNAVKETLADRFPAIIERSRTNLEIAGRLIAS